MRFNLRVRYTRDQILFGTCFIVAWILIALNNSNPDYGTYKEIYNLFKETGINTSDMEIGYILIMRFSIFLDLPFYAFWGTTTTAALLLIANSFKTYSSYPGLVMLLYCIACLLFDCVTLRHFLASAIVLFAIRFLDDKKMLYIICVLLAMSLSAMSIVYLPACIVTARIVRPKTYGLLFGCSTLIVLFGRIAIINILSSYYIAAGRYIAPIQTTYKPFIVYTALYIVCEIVLFNIWYRQVPNRGRKQDKVIYLFTLYVMVLLPLLLLELTYARIYRFGLVLLFILAESLPKKIGEKYNIPAYRIVIVGIAFANAILFYGFGKNNVTILQTIFRNNYLFSLLI